MNKRTLTICVTISLLLAGCGGGTGPKKDKDFFTSGDREADQRADQRMARAQQLKGEGSGKAGDKPANEKAPLFERLGGQQGLTAIVDDFTPRVLADPRVNWERKGVKQGGFSIHRNKSVEWNASKENVDQLKKHLVQFLTLATGGPAHYDGLDMKQAHAGKNISNAEFDAAVGDMKATLDALKIPNQEQKELLAIVESTRSQVAEER